MKQIRECNSGQLVMRLEGDQICDWNSGRPLYRVDGDQVREGGQWGRIYIFDNCFRIAVIMANVSLSPAARVQNLRMPWAAAL